jgi:hypothetical protein
MRKTLAVPRTLTVADAQAFADRLEPNGRLQTDQATAAKLIRALPANSAASDAITLQDD